MGPSESPWLLMLMSSLGEFEAVPLGASEVLAPRNPPVAPASLQGKKLRGKEQGLHPGPEMEEVGSSSGEKEGGIPETWLQGPGVGPRSSISSKPAAFREVLLTSGLPGFVAASGGGAGHLCVWRGHNRGDTVRLLWLPGLRDWDGESPWLLSPSDPPLPGGLTPNAPAPEDEPASCGHREGRDHTPVGRQVAWAVNQVLPILLLP